jgi:erythromycin esterase
MTCLVSLIAATVISQAPPIQIDERVGDLMARAVVIESIDPQDDDDFSDLQPLKKLIGGARLVVLGEQSHGDGAVFYAKARLIKFLHQEMGFDVLAWESGMFDCREVDRAMRDPDASMDTIRTLGIFGIWTASAQVMPTLNYVRQTIKTDRPIETCGFDHQFSGAASHEWPKAMLAFFDKADPKILSAEQREDTVGGFRTMRQRNADGVPDAQAIAPLVRKWTAIGQLMDDHHEALVKAHGQAEFEFMRRCADDAVVSVKATLQFSQNRGNMKATDNNVRDERMAENLVWLVNDKYKDRKIIAWMATMHAVHDVQQIHSIGGPDIYEGVINCGTAARKVIGDKTYTIGFTAADGKAGNVSGRWSSELAAPSKGSLEDLCLQSGVPFLFIDFRGLPADHWLRKNMVSRPLGYGEMLAAWPAQVDAMFYIQTMFPSTREDALPPYARVRADQ